MAGGGKSELEFRVELLTWGAALLGGAAMWVAFSDVLPSLVLFIPGLILLGSAIFQDMQPDWSVSWFTYFLAILVVALGLAGIINTLLGEVVKLNWLVLAIAVLGAVLIAKALYDQSVRRRA
ncbi:MAG: hypothetical protein Kow00124_07470 [Anaerolineae bacterium]